MNLNVTGIVHTSRKNVAVTVAACVTDLAQKAHVLLDGSTERMEANA